MDVIEDKYFLDIRKEYKNEEDLGCFSYRSHSCDFK